MDVKNLALQQDLTGWLLILSFLIFTPGGILYAGRAILKWPVGKNPAYLYWERGLVIAAVVVVFLGWVLLEKMLEAAGDSIFAPLGLGLLFISTVLNLGAETYDLSKREWLYAPVVVHVVLAFLGQAVFGLALLQTGLLAAWTGWATILWNLILLVVMPVRDRHNIYYPWLHYIAPLLIGISLLIKG